MDPPFVGRRDSLLEQTGGRWGLSSWDFLLHTNQLQVVTMERRNQASHLQGQQNNGATWEQSGASGSPAPPHPQETSFPCFPTCTTLAWWDCRMWWPSMCR